MPRILQRCSFAYMKEHENKFDISHGILYKMGVPADRAFIRKGKVGEGKTELTSEMKETYARQLNTELEGMGLDQYKD